MNTTGCSAGPSEGLAASLFAPRLQPGERDGMRRRQRASSALMQELLQTTAKRNGGHGVSNSSYLPKAHFASNPFRLPPPKQKTSRGRREVSG